MDFRPLPVAGAVEFVPPVFPDARGSFAAPFQAEAFVAAVGHRLRIDQTNHSRSRTGVIRGIHYADTPPGQAKYVYASAGRFVDVLVDLRLGSPGFGTHTAVDLDATRGNAVYVPEGVGHLVVALEDDAALTYLCSRGYSPGTERTLDPRDPEIALPLDEWLARADGRPAGIISTRDLEAPTLAESRSAGHLPSFDDCEAWYAGMRRAHRGDHSVG